MWQMLGTAGKQTNLLVLTGVCCLLVIFIFEKEMMRKEIIPLGIRY